MNNKNKIQNLSEKINQARHHYYNEQPLVSDATFDEWVDELSKLDPNNPAITSVGAPVVSEWKKAAHTEPMQSLNKANTTENLISWADSCNLINNVFCVEKLDGISINTVWTNGVITQAITRGDGEVGEDITVNVLKMKGINKLKNKFTGNIRGEIILLKSDHEKHFKNYANPRNAASGVSKRLDGVGAEFLTVMMYSANKNFSTELEQFNWLKSLGLLVPNYKLCANIEEAINYFNDYQNGIRQKLNYDIDGVVIRVNDISKQFSLGEKNHRPKGAIAFKFKADSAVTTLKNISWNVGPTGRITPVGEFEQVYLSGAKIDRASLYNYSYIKNLKLDVGAKILVIRANDVIPRIESVVGDTQSIAAHPNFCPECKANISWSGEYLVCINKTLCPAQKLGRLSIWIKELNILEWADTTLQKIIDAGLADDISDLYNLSVEQLENLERMGNRLAKKLINILQNHKEIPLENFIGGLGIEGVATTTTKLIIDAGYTTLDSLMQISKSELENIEGFGEIRANAFYNGLKDNKNRIKNILSVGIKIKPKVIGRLSGSFCFTGPSKNTRAQLHKMVQDNGGTVKKSVGKGLSYLVVANVNSNSNKMQAAKKFNTKIITENEFLKMLK